MPEPIVPKQPIKKDEPKQKTVQDIANDIVAFSLDLVGMVPEDNKSAQKVISELEKEPRYALLMLEKKATGDSKAFFLSLGFYLDSGCCKKQFTVMESGFFCGHAVKVGDVIKTTHKYAQGLVMSGRLELNFKQKDVTFEQKTDCKCKDESKDK